MIAGATVFMFLERDNEVVEKQIYMDKLDAFLTAYPTINRTDLDAILKVHAEADSAGFAGAKRPRWDFPGSFYFVGTVVSTIGEFKYDNVYFKCHIIPLSLFCH